MRRMDLSVWNRTTIGQKLPNDSEMKKSFIEYTRELIEKINFSPNEIFNMDEVPIAFDVPPSQTVDKVGANSIPIITTGHERNCFTMVLACSADGQKLPPLIIFKRKTLPKKDFLKEIVIQVNPKG